MNQEALVWGTVIIGRSWGSSSPPKISLASGLRVYPRSPGTHTVGPWVTDSIQIYRDLRTGTQYIGNWASGVYVESKFWVRG